LSAFFIPPINSHHRKFDYRDTKFVGGVYRSIILVDSSK
jgi:hypothetical protein